MTIHKLSNSYYIKKGTFTYSDSNPGDSRNQKMWRCCSLIASDYMKFCINPLRLVSVPPPPPHTSSAPSFSGSVAYRHPCSLLHVVYRGVPKQFPLTKVPGIQLLKNLSNPLFLCRLASVHFRNTLCRKMLSLLHHSIIRESFPDLSFVAVFHPSLINANYLCRRTFWNLPA